MVLFSSSCARLTQIQMKANRLKTSWAVGTVLCASTTEPLLQGRAVLSQQSYCFQPQSLHFQKNQPSKKNKHSPYTLLWTPVHGGTVNTDLRCHQIGHWPSCAAPHRPAVHLPSCSTCHWAQGCAARHSLVPDGLEIFHLEWFTLLPCLLFASTSPCNR